eukprot:m.38349 g.38349  ORF g.38349 m.38349 type:complete len:1691 (-) comp11480_c1_seq1:2027-7099(-)
MAATIGSFWDQVRVLLFKNLLVKRRWRRQTTFEMFFPVYMSAIVCLINLAAKSSNFAAAPYHVSSTLDPNVDIGVLAYVAYNPDQHDVITRTTTLLAEHQIKPQSMEFQSEDDLVSWYNHNVDSLWAAVVFPENPDPGYFNYTIRMQVTSDSASASQPQVPDSGSLTTSFGDCRGNSSCTTGLYQQSGFLLLQHTLQQAYYLLHGGDSALIPDIQTTRMPLPSYSASNNAGIRVSAVILTIMAFSPIIQYLMTNVVAEKEKGIKDALYLMGMRPLAYWVSWLLTYMLVLVIPCALVAVVSKFFGVLQNSNFFAIFIVLYVFSLSISSLAFVFTPFFSKAKIAGVAGSLSNTLMSLLIFGLRGKSISASTKYGVSVASPCAALLALQQILTLDDDGGFNFSNFSTGQYSVLSAVLMMLGDTLIYLVLAWYLDAVVPGNGPKKSPFFLVHDLLALFGIRHSSQAPLANEELILEGEREDESDFMSTHHAIIQIENVGMSYNKEQRPALSNVSLRLYEGQIFGLLGHNGAGKTTLHSIITGLRNPTLGRVLVNGLDVSTDAGREAMRNIMGVCPQHDVLYEKLTVKEHLTLFSGIKGVKSKDRERVFAQLLREIDLQDKADEFTEHLSGGQKRKLSVGIALIGDPQILCLDEPSSGMDPYSRRKLWELLQSKRAGRVTLLTTHYMQEADILADRKAIMSRGRVQCVGSSLFLKSRYGVGYHLHLAKSDAFDADGVHAVISQHVQKATQEEGESSTEVSYALPHSETRRFGALFGQLTTEKQQLGLRSFGVSMTTLEEVFVRLHQLEEEAEIALSVKKSTDTSTSTPQDRLLSINSETGPISHLASGNHDGEDDDEEARGLDPDSHAALNRPLLGKDVATGQKFSTFGDTQRPAPSSSSSSSSFSSSAQDGEKAGFFSVVWALMIIRWKQRVREWRALFFQVFMPAVLLVISLTVVAKPTDKSGTDGSKPVLPLDPKLYGSTYLEVPIVDAAGAFFHRLNTSHAFAASGAHLKYLQSDVKLQGTSGFLTEHMNGYSCAFDVTQDTTTLGVNMFYNTTILHAPAIFMAQIGNSFLESINVEVSAASHPLPAKRDVTWDASVFYTVLLIGIGLSAIPGGFAINAVKDRQCKMKHLLEVSGVSNLAYWLADLLTSMSIFSFSVLFAIILTIASNVDPLLGPGLPLFILLCLVYMPLTILFAYLVSYLFSDAETCQSVFPPLNNFLGFIPYIVVGTLDGVGQATIARILHYILAVLLPPYSLIGALYYMFRLHTVASYDLTNPHASVADYWAPDNNVSPTLIIMIASIGFEIALLFIINNYKQLRNRFRQKDALLDHPETEREELTNLSALGIKEDVDVLKERERVLSAQSADDLLRVQRLRKTFTSGGGMFSSGSTTFVAVHDSSFGIRRGDVLGLLGPNGAGKTTTLAMVTGEEYPTAGDISVCDFSLQTQKWDAMHHMGFCPQFSAIWDNITTAEHLLFFAQIKGQSKRKAEALKRAQLKLLGIEEHESKHAQKLSGGTQRKLSVAIAMINSPDVCLLDEPSTGLDPQSKRVLWNVIKRRLQQTAAILTTHSMEEAEALCNKIVIMVKGRLVCFGSPTHLKSTYGSGYTLEIKTQAASTQAVHDFIAKNLPNAQQEENFSGFLSYQLDMEDSQLAEVFGLLEDNKSALHISEYAVSQSSLEQVFLRFAKLQDIEL